MMEVCPQVDFYISATVSLTNSLHIVDFHRSWAEQGLIKPSDFNFNLLQNPPWLRMDLLPIEYKQQVKEKYEKHMEWLDREGDPLTRATQGYKSALDWMFRRDKTAQLQWYFDNTKKYDAIRNEKSIDVFPEWKELFEKYDKNKA